MNPVLRARRARGQRRRGADDEFFVPSSHRKLRRFATIVGEQALMLAICAVSLIPFYAMLVTAFKTSDEFNSNMASLALPEQWTFTNFTEAWSGLGFDAMLWNSAVLSVVSALATTVVSALGGFALARMEFHGRRPLLVSMVVLMSVPAIVVVVPLFVAMSAWGILNTYPAAIIAEIGLGTPFGIYLVYTFMRDAPVELFQAAQLEGASLYRQFWSVAVPLARPVLSTVALVTGIFAWNDLLIPLLLWQSEELRVLMVGLANLAPGRGAAVDVPLVMAGVVISTAPVIGAFVLMRRFFVQGFVEGALR